MGGPTGVSSCCCNCLRRVLTQISPLKSCSPHPRGMCRLCPQLLTALGTAVQPETNDWLVSKPLLNFPEGGGIYLFLFSVPIFSCWMALALAFSCQLERDL